MTSRIDKMLFPWERREHTIQEEHYLHSINDEFEMAEVFFIENKGWQCIVCNSQDLNDDTLALDRYDLPSIEEAKKLAEETLLKMGWEIIDEKVAMLL